MTRSEKALIRSSRVARLATADAAGSPHVIPICFVFDGEYFYSPIDEKPKQVKPQKLKRLRNIEQNPNVALVIDHYEENWRKLGYVLAQGKARVITKGEKHRNAVRLLRKKYPQYRHMAIHERPMIIIRPNRVISWSPG